jgi:hypothetical protein
MASEWFLSVFKCQYTQKSATPTFYRPPTKPSILLKMYSYNSSEITLQIRLYIAFIPIKDDNGLMEQWIIIIIPKVCMSHIRNLH